MTGALYLAEDQPELAEYFTPGQEVLTYTDREDLLDKARYYLAPSRSRPSASAARASQRARARAYLAASLRAIVRRPRAARVTRRA